MIRLILTLLVCSQVCAQIEYSNTGLGNGVAVRSGTNATATVKIEYKMPTEIVYNGFRILPGVGCFDLETGEKLGNKCERGGN